MEDLDSAIKSLFKRYQLWLKTNNLRDSIYNYIYYLDNIEKTSTK